MGRRPRIDPEFGIHHVFSRGTRRWVLYQDDVDRGRFVGQLGRVAEQHRTEILSFCLMDNHFHLMLRCPDAGLSAALRDLKSTYARWYNARHNYSGPVFEGRFGSVLVTSHRQIKRLIRYIHRNPYAISPNLNLADYRWSSHSMYLGLRPPPVWMSITIGRELFADYRLEVETPIATDAVQNSTCASETVPGTVSLENEPLSLAHILQAVAHVARCDVLDVNPGRRNGLIGIAVLLAHEMAGYSASEIAEPFGYRGAAAVRTAAHRARQRRQSDTSLMAIHQGAMLILRPRTA